MTQIIAKKPELKARLMKEVENFFEMTRAQRNLIENAIACAVDPNDEDWSYEDLLNAIQSAGCKIAGQPLESQNWTDADGNPDGGYVEGPGLQIRWQRGAVDPDDEDGAPWNGCFLVTVLEAAKRQLEFYQSGKYNCRENKAAMLHIESAINILNERQIERFMRGVRGIHEV